MAILLCSIALPCKSYAQIVADSNSIKVADTATLGLKDSLRTQVNTAKTDTVVVPKGPFQPNPKKSGLYSALIPGTGQLYNRQYWKVPIIYGGLGVAGYFIYFNLTQFHDFRKAYISRLNAHPPYTDKYANIYPNATDLKTLQDSYEQTLDMVVLFTSLGYIAQVLDAVAFAHLKNFDISPSLSMKVRPVAMPVPFGGVGMGLVVNLK